MTLLQNRVFAKMFAAYGLSTLGDWFDFIAVSMLLGFVWHAEPMMLALLPLAYALPSVLLSQFAGMAADRSNKLRVMILTDLIRAALTVLLIFAPNAWWLLALVFVRSTAEIFYTPAHQSLTRQVVPEDQLLQAASLNGTVFQSGKLIGPLLGGSLAALASPALCLLINAFSFVLSAVCLLMIDKGSVRETASEQQQETAAGQAEKQSWLQSWMEGWRILLKNRILLASTLFSLLALAAIQLIDAQFVTILREKAPDRPELLGYLISAIGVGALLAVSVMSRFSEINAYGWVLGGGVLLIGIMVSGAGLYQPGSSILLLLAAAFLGGIGTGLTTVCSSYLRQKETPREAIGRVTGILDSLSSSIFIIAPLLGGLLVQTWGASLSFQWIGLLIGGIGGSGILLQKLIRRSTQEKRLLEM
ncbi:MFS transporter [Brevibacillus ruminantium]|uniref:MFS transporter n=1 Tax=Brevibacillus ruminantium TaxID=2950604 RepID=A0ABY4WCR5_9BACL|nr:MFS transporter [Brevibacillus ruminantium]USG64848.1 MFS transporter [Brevibacillus ruminantium]